MSLKINGFTELKREIATIDKKFKKDAKEVQAKTVLYAMADLQDPSTSPIDKGRYIASHQFESARGTWAAPEGLESSKYAGIAKQNEAEVKSKTFDFKNAVFWIANNLEYAPLLEAGRSKQAPGTDAIYGKVADRTNAYAKRLMKEIERKKY